MSITLRDAVATDEPRVQELLAALSAAAGTGSTPNISATFASLLAKERGRLVVAEEDGRILGMVSVSYNLALRCGEYCQLEELIVDPEARGKNVGGLLVQKSIDDARARGCAEYGLYLVEKTEHNRPFYEKYGIEAVGTEMRMPL
ncbi:MAG: GNAT family N-acetyltransferase [Acidobacteriota bacterium]